MAWPGLLLEEVRGEADAGREAKLRDVLASEQAPLMGTNPFPWELIPITRGDSLPAPGTQEGVTPTTHTPPSPQAHPPTPPHWGSRFNKSFGGNRHTASRPRQCWGVGHRSHLCLSLHFARLLRALVHSQFGRFLVSLRLLRRCAEQLLRAPGRGELLAVPESEFARGAHRLTEGSLGGPSAKQHVPGRAPTTVGKTQAGLPGPTTPWQAGRPGAKCGHGGAFPGAAAFMLRPGSLGGVGRGGEPRAQHPARPGRGCDAECVLWLVPQAARWVRATPWAGPACARGGEGSLPTTRFAASFPSAEGCNVRRPRCLLPAEWLLAVWCQLGRRDEAPTPAVGVGGKVSRCSRWSEALCGGHSGSSASTCRGIVGQGGVFAGFQKGTVRS
ncbi:hypothetical protein AAY473_002355 [Plecturocebus cupreus]